MRLISLTADNFLKFERVEIEFPDGLTGIIGPNGVGKSSLTEAIAWALYGSPVQRSRNQGMPFRGNKPCRVDLALEIGGDEYRVIRELRGQACVAHAEVLRGRDQPEASGTERVNQFIARLLRMDYRAFLVSYFAQQKEVAQISGWEPSERKRYILRLLGLERVERALEMVRRDAGDSARELRASEAALPDPKEIEAARNASREKVARATEQRETAGAALHATDQELAVARERREELNARQQQHAERVRQRDVARKALDGAIGEEAIHARAVRDLRESVAEIARLDPQIQPLTALRARKQALDLAAGMEKHRTSLLRRIAGGEKTAADLATEITALEKQVATRDRVHLAHAEAEAAAAQHRERLTDLQGQVKAYQAQLAQKKKDAQKLKQDLDALNESGRKGRCPTCRRVLNGSFQDVIAHLEAERTVLRQEYEECSRFIQEDSAHVDDVQGLLNEAVARGRQLNLELNSIARAEAALSGKRAEASRNAAELQKAREDLTEMGAVAYDAAAHRDVKARVETLEKIEHRVIGLRQEVRRLPDEEAAVAQKRQAVSRLESELRAAEESLAAVGFDAAAFEAQRAEHRALESRQRAQSDAYHRADTERERALVEQQQAEERRERYRQQRDDITALRAHKENLDELLQLMKKFHEDLIGRIRPALAARTASLVRDLTDGRYDRVELDAEYNLSMYDDGERRELRAFSGGENDLVHLCLRLAISEMIGDSAGGAEHGFLVLDEVLGSQDGERRALILTALARLGRRFRQILMITHVEDVKEMVDHVFEVRETASGSSELVAA